MHCALLFVRMHELFVHCLLQNSCVCVAIYGQKILADTLQPVHIGSVRVPSSTVLNYLLAPDRLLVPRDDEPVPGWIEFYLAYGFLLKSCCDQWQLARGGIERVHQIRGRICEKPYQSTLFHTSTLDMVVCVLDSPFV